MTEKSNSSKASETEKNKKFPTFALLLAFVPSFLLLVVFSVFGILKNGSPWFTEMFVFFGLISLACCFLASFMMFSTKKRNAIAVGIILLALNILISFYFGCSALINHIAHS
ncbi:MAG: hypothetical protein M3Y82_12195 [Verrucomicrobiota bacterium]|nr:hypothetical protein [Verrucomicrobiota bacterium]